MKPDDQGLTGKPRNVLQTRSISNPLVSGKKPGTNRLEQIRTQPSPKIYGKIGDLEVYLAQKRGEIRKAQKLRYKVFYEELSAIPDTATRLVRRDQDSFDDICDHLLVVDKGNRTKNNRRRLKNRHKIVGTYRVLCQHIAEQNNGYYTQSEYDIAPLIKAKSPNYKFLELGRSCVLKPYRNRRSVELLWRGLWTYAREHGCNVMLGCASFPGTDPGEHAMALSFLHHNVMAPENWRVRAHHHLYHSMDMIPKNQIDQKIALKALPPLIKGYLRLGAFVGDGAVIDHQFGTTDVLIILPIEVIDPKYFSHFGAPDEVAAPVSAEPSQLI